MMSSLLVTPCQNIDVPSEQNKKQGGPNWYLKQSVDSGPITKDEEEVVETLYALAGMFPDNETDIKTKMDSASLDTSALALPGLSGSHPPKVEDTVAVKEDLNANCLSKTDGVVNTVTDMKRSPEEIFKTTSLNGPSIHEVSDFSSTENLNSIDNSSATKVKLQKMEVKHEEQKPLSN